MSGVHILRLFSLLGGVTLYCAGCSQTQRVFDQVELCVQDDRGVAELKRLVRSVAEAEKLQFIDKSDQQSQSLKSMGADKALGRDASKAIDLHIEDNNVGMTAGNLGLPPYQVGIGFAEGGDPDKARRFANRLIDVLSEHWVVQHVPPDRGVTPTEACGS